ncbi:MAG: hypothetical protein ABSF28_18465 [Terracidiphilus sp.]|jgi:hypothetical protein
MTKQQAMTSLYQSMTLLSRLLLVSRDDNELSSSKMPELSSEIRNITRGEFDALVNLANSNHVIVRGLEVVLDIVRKAKDDTRIEWAETALAVERARIGTALMFLEEICRVFEYEGRSVAVIKSLDHWPDLGSDLDLYTDANPKNISKLMADHFGAQIASRSWGDRLAGKWNFLIPGLREAVEVHVGRLGQTGEQVTIASHLMERTRRVMVGNHSFRVTSTSDRLMISTLQRMYRHFYFRLCDVIDSAALVEMGAIEWQDLRYCAANAGIWEGVATYLVIVSDYVRKYRGCGLELPHFVRAAARFGGDDVFYAREFLRVPIMPQSIRLYGTQLAGLMRNLELVSGARLSLLPWLATAALVGQRITGSDKGIW